ncbi:MAG: outer membrane beta-barrel protein, partial [Candidatus Kapabacteria bacterium]|nr:outer membrane beta-barrel protein [Candidatus Kapabacteria bacterium]
MNRIARLAIASCTMTCIFSLNSIAQTPETDAPPAPPAATNAKPTVGFSSYVDTYYASDNDRSASANRSMLNALAPNKNTAGVNLMQVTGTIDAPNYRAKATLHYGDLPRVSWLADGADPLTPAASLQEAYAGVSFANGLWIDAGYFLTHIGGEVIQAKDNWLSTLAMVTQFEPFFQAGLRVNYDAHPNLSLQGLLLNGYNRFTDNNNSKSIGYMITYRPDANLNFTLGGLSGNEQPNGAASANRLYHSLVMNATPSSDFLIRAQADVALQQAVGDGASSTSTVGGYVAMR